MPAPADDDSAADASSVDASVIDLLSAMSSGRIAIVGIE